MIGRLYVNELTPESVMLEFSTWPGQILNAENPLGFAYGKTLDLLGIDRHYLLGDYRPGVVLGGTLEQAQGRCEVLQRSIGLIARIGSGRERYGAAFTRDFIGRTLGKLCQNQLQACETFQDVAVAVTQPFAEAANDGHEAFHTVYGQVPFWAADSPLYSAGREKAIQAVLENER